MSLGGRWGPGQPPTEQPESGPGVTAGPEGRGLLRSAEIPAEKSSSRPQGFLSQPVCPLSRAQKLCYFSLRWEEFHNRAWLCGWSWEVEGSSLWRNEQFGAGGVDLLGARLEPEGPSSLGEGGPVPVGLLQPLLTQPSHQLPGSSAGWSLL